MKSRRIAILLVLVGLIALSLAPTASYAHRPAAATAALPCALPYQFNQGDYTDLMNGRPPGSSYTIQSHGCFITSAAMILSYYGAYTTPPQLNTILGEWSYKFSAWRAAEQAGQGKVRHISGSGGVGQWPFGYDLLAQELRHGRPAFLWLTKGNGSHAVVVIGGEGSSPGNYTIVDPSGGVERNLTYYTNNGWTPYALHIFDGTPWCQSPDLPPRLGESPIHGDGTCSLGATAPAQEWWIAEGYQRPSHDVYILLYNPNDATANVTVDYFLSAGVETRTYNVDGHRRHTICLREVFNDDFGGVGARIYSALPIVAEGAMYWNEWYSYTSGPGKRGGHGGLAANTLATTWYLPEGYVNNEWTGNWIAVLNPHYQAATVTVTYYKEDGSTVVQAYTANARSRLSITVGDTPGPGSYGARVESTLPVAVERVAYWWDSSATNSWRVGHRGVGATALSNTWHFAEGYLGPTFEDFISVINPGDAPAVIDITYMGHDGVIKTAQRTVGAHARGVIRASDDLGVGSGYSYATTLSSSQPIAAERSQYWDNRHGAHAGIGSPTTAAQWYFAEGYTGRPTATQTFDTWFLVQNPGAQMAVVNVTFYPQAGQAIHVKPLNVPAYSRLTIHANDYLSVSFATEIQADQPIVAERAMYWTPPGTLEQVSTLYDYNNPGPQPPTGVGATPVAGTSYVDVWWQASPDADVAGYHIYRLTDEGLTRANANLVTGLSFRDTGASYGQTYAYLVTGVDTNGTEGGYHTLISVNTPAGASTTPQITSASAVPFTHPGGQGEIYVLMTNLDEGYEIDLTLAYNPAVIQLLDADASQPGIQAALGTLFPGGGSSFAVNYADYVTENAADNGTGRLRLRLALTAPAAPFRGSGTVLCIPFQAQAAGQTTLALTVTALRDLDGHDITANVSPGTVKVAAYVVYLPRVSRK